MTTGSCFLCALLLAGFSAAALMRALYGHAQRRWRTDFRAARERLRREIDDAGLALGSRWELPAALIGSLARSGIRLLQKRRGDAADRQLPDALAMIAGALRSGLALSQAIEAASLELPPPLGAELARAVAQMKLGQTTEQALKAMAERLSTDDAHLVAQSVEVLRRTGGNLGESFRTLAATIEARQGVEERIRVLAFQNLAQAAVLLAMPWLLAAALMAVAPDFIVPLFSTRIGAVIVLVALLLELIGGWWLRRIAFIRV